MSPIKSDTVDMQLEFEFKENVSANTTIYCVILHDRMFEYSLLFNVVRKITSHKLRYLQMSPLSQYKRYN